MKKHVLILFFLIVLININESFAQVGIGVSTENINPSAQLEVVSTTKGFLPPRLTTTQRDSINGGNPAEGLVIFNTTKNCMQYKSDTGWVSVIPSTGTSSTTNAESVTIGTQIWATKNLNVDRYRNGDIIPQVTDPIQWGRLTTGAWCWYNDDSNYATSHGKMYNGYAVTDPRGLAPAGWHIASFDDWWALTETLGGVNVAGGAIKSITGWAAPNIGATNSSGFSALAGGELGIAFLYNTTQPGIDQKMGIGCRWWTSTEYSNDLRYTTVGQLSPYLHIVGVAQKYYGFYVRCVKD